MFLRKLLIGRRFSQGFTLMEVLVVLGLFIVVAGLGFRYLRADPNRASAIGLAEEFAQELRSARDEAITEQVPVGVAFPTNAGSVYVCKGIYTLKGEDVPRISRSLKFDSAYGDTALCVGKWSNPDADVPVLRADGDEFDITAWLTTAAVSDPAIVFLPSGAVVATMPSYEGRYGVLVSTSFKLSGDTIDSAHRAETVWVNALGEVLVETGSPASVADKDIGDNSGAALPPPRQTAGPDSPVISQVRSEPDFSDGNYDHLPGDVWGGLRREEYVTLIVEATDPNGGPLYTEWTGPGQFSSPSEGRMQWDETTDVWRSTWTWSPPKGSDPPGEPYDLSCRVRDEQDNETASSSAQSPRFVLSSDTILAAHDRKSGSLYQVLLMTEEGHVTHTIPLAGQSPSPLNLSSDGTSFLIYEAETSGDSVVFYRENGTKFGTLFPGRHASFNVAQNEIISVSPVGTTPTYLEWYPPAYVTPQRLDAPGAAPKYPVKHSEAIVAHIALPTTPSTQAMAYFLTTDTDPFLEKVIFDTDISGNVSASISPDGGWILYPTDGAIHAVPNPPFLLVAGVREPVTPMTLTAPPAINRNVVFSPTGDEVLFYIQSGSGHELWRAEIDLAAIPPTLLNERQVSRRSFSSSARGLCWFTP